ncbi:YwiC-like family protein [Arcanobacterium haemolyticum]|nr:YwiC-like family protein [Arcanobacterium haemolyticum]
MIAVPPLVGIMESGGRAAHILLLATWWLGYFCFYAATLWLKSRFNHRYARPVAVYGTATAACGTATLVVAPYLLRWVPLFLPLVLVAGVAAWLREDRSLWSGFATVAAASLLLPVAWDVSSAGTSGFSGTTTMWLHTALLFGYFGGTVLYVKTNIRERRSTGYLMTSIAWHGAWTVIALLAVNGIHGATVSMWHGAVWVLLTARAVLVPLAGRAGHPVSVMAIGVGEVVSCVAIAATLLL